LVFLTALIPGFSEEIPDEGAPRRARAPNAKIIGILSEPSKKEHRNQKPSLIAGYCFLLRATEIYVTPHGTERAGALSKTASLEATRLFA
jgi:hypothetical protein